MVSKFSNTLPDERGNYKILRRLAVGGMAEIYLAERTKMHGFRKNVVIKSILPQFADDSTYVEMFLDEARLVARLNHPSIVQVFDIGKQADCVFFAMEYVEGHDLAELLGACYRQQRMLTVEEILAIAVPVAEALHHAHDLQDEDGVPMNVVHRDVSPSNIIVTREGSVKLLDFGVAKSNSHQCVTTGVSLKGKFGYISPEQCQGLPLDRRSDIFSYGVVLWELATGRRLFPGGNEPSVLLRVMHEDAPAPSSVRSDLPLRIDEICLRALLRDRDQRYSSLQNLLTELDGFRREHNTVTTSRTLTKLLSDIFPFDADSSSRTNSRGPRRPSSTEAILNLNMPLTADEDLDRSEETTDPKIQSKLPLFSDLGISSQNRPLPAQDAGDDGRPQHASSSQWTTASPSLNNSAEHAPPPTNSHPVPNQTVQKRSFETRSIAMVITAALTGGLVLLFFLRSSAQNGAAMQELTKSPSAQTSAATSAQTADDSVYLKFTGLPIGTKVHIEESNQSTTIEKNQKSIPAVSNTDITVILTKKNFERQTLSILTPTMGTKVVPVTMIPIPEFDPAESPDNDTDSADDRYQRTSTASERISKRNRRRGEDTRSRRAQRIADANENTKSNTQDVENKSGKSEDKMPPESSIEPKPVASTTITPLPIDKPIPEEKPKSITDFPLPAAKPRPPKDISSKALELLRISGEKEIRPTNLVNTEIHRSGKKVIGVFKMCVNVRGQISSLKMLRSTGYSSYDRKIQKGIRDWRYKPYKEHGVAIPVCTSVVFHYST